MISYGGTATEVQQIVLLDRYGATTIRQLGCYSASLRAVPVSLRVPVFPVQWLSSHRPCKRRSSQPSSPSAQPLRPSRSFRPSTPQRAKEGIPGDQKGESKKGGPKGVQGRPKPVQLTPSPSVCRPYLHPIPREPRGETIATKEATGRGRIVHPGHQEPGAAAVGTGLAVGRGMYEIPRAPPAFCGESRYLAHDSRPDRPQR